MIELKSKREIDLMQKSAEIIQKIFKAVEPAVKEGVMTEELDAIAHDVIVSQGGTPAFKGYRGFPKSSCISVNEEIVHGIPGKRKLQDGDLISFDVGVILNDYYGDSARSWCVGNASDETKALVETAKGSLEAALEAYRPGCKIGDLSAVIQEHIESRGFGVVRDFVGHGIGKELHEDPQVPNYGKSGRGVKMEAGLVIAIEPMVTAGNYDAKILDDGWTVVTDDNSWASHYEDTIAFLDDGFINLTGGYSKKL